MSSTIVQTNYDREYTKKLLAQNKPSVGYRGALADAVQTGINTKPIIQRKKMNLKEGTKFICGVSNSKDLETIEKNKRKISDYKKIPNLVLRNNLVNNN